MGGAASVVGLKVLMIWSGTGVVAISWIIALAALMLGALDLLGATLQAVQEACEQPRAATIKAE